jgi:chromosome segregation ATPase
MTDKIAPGELMNEVNALARERNMLRAKLEQYQAEFREQITEEHAAYQELRRAAERLQAYADSHPCDHMPACQV